MSAAKACGRRRRRTPSITFICMARPATTGTMSTTRSPLPDRSATVRRASRWNRIRRTSQPPAPASCKAEFTPKTSTASSGCIAISANCRLSGRRSRTGSIPIRCSTNSPILRRQSRSNRTARRFHPSSSPRCATGSTSSTRASRPKRWPFPKASATDRDRSSWCSHSPTCSPPDCWWPRCC